MHLYLCVVLYPRQSSPTHPTAATPPVALSSSPVSPLLSGHLHIPLPEHSPKGMANHQMELTQYWMYDMVKASWKGKFRILKKGARDISCGHGFMAVID